MGCQQQNMAKFEPALSIGEEEALSGPSGRSPRTAQRESVRPCEHVRPQTQPDYTAEWLEQPTLQPKGYEVAHETVQWDGARHLALQYPEEVTDLNFQTFPFPNVGPEHA